MKNIILDKTEYTPSVIFDKNIGVFEISGKSLPEDSFGFYEPLVDWLNEYLMHPNQKTVFKFDLVYFNTASAKMFFEMLNAFDRSFLKGNDIEIVWCFNEEDEYIFEAGEDFADLLKVPFRFSVLTD